MTTIARLTKQTDGSFTGTLTTLALHAANIRIVPEFESDNEKAPAYRVFTGNFEPRRGLEEDLESRQALHLGQAG